MKLKLDQKIYDIIPWMEASTYHSFMLKLGYEIGDLNSLTHQNQSWFYGKGWHISQLSTLIARDIQTGRLTMDEFKLILAPYVLGAKE